MKKRELEWSMNREVEYDKKTKERGNEKKGNGKKLRKGQWKKKQENGSELTTKKREAKWEGKWNGK